MVSVFLVCFAISSVAKAATVGLDPSTAGLKGWVASPDVSAAGGAIARSHDVLNWAFQISNSGFNTARTVLSGLWKNIRDFTLIIFVAIIVIISFGIILRTDWGTRWRRLLPYIIIALIVMNFSFIASATIVSLADKAQQGAYSLSGSSTLNANQIYNIGFTAKDFKGYRQGEFYQEDAVRTQLWLVRFATYTNYAIALIIITRIIVLWGLTIFAPLLFPFIVFPVTRKVALIWAKEFFRWIFIGPLLALFLSCVIYIWTNTSIPNISSSTTSISYSSATNIVLTAPGGSGDVNDIQGYMRFVVTLVMLWVAIILPFLLLRTSIVTIAKNRDKITKRWDNSATKQYFSKIGGQLNTRQSRKTASATISSLAKPITVAGIAQPQTTLSKPHINAPIPQYAESKNLSDMKLTSIVQLAGLTQAIPETRKILESASPKLETIARIETDNYKISKSQEILNKILKPQNIERNEDRRLFSEIHNSINNMSTKGDTYARSFQNATENNFATYSNANTREEVQKQVVQKFAKQINNFTRNDQISTTLNKETSVSRSVPSRLYGQINKNRTTNISNLKNDATNTFQKIYNTSTTNLREYLSQKSENNEENATLAIKALDQLSDITQIADKPLAQITPKDKTNAMAVTKKLEHPEMIADEDEKKQFSALRNVVDSGIGKGDKEASMFDYTSKLLLWANDADESGKLTEDIDKQLLKRTTNEDDDYKKTEDLWKNYYMNTPVPISEKIKNRKDWLESEKNILQNAVNQLLSHNKNERDKGLEVVKNIVPFMLMGNYSATDIAKYLMAKIDAIDKAVVELERIENGTTGAAKFSQNNNETSENDEDSGESPKLDQ